MVCAPWPHHERTRSGGEQRGITVNAARLAGTAQQAFAQVSAQAAPKCPQLPKLMAACRRHGPAVATCSGRRQVR